MIATFVVTATPACGFSVASPTVDDAAPVDTAPQPDQPLQPDTPTCLPPGPQLSGLQRGSLVFGANDRAAFAPLADVPMDRSVLFTTLRQREASPANGAVLCRMMPADSTKPFGIRCQRWTQGSDTPGSQGVIDIQWAVATFSSGVSVQHGDANTAARNPFTVTLPQAVDLARSFVLLSGEWVRQPDWGNNEFVKARLVDERTLDVRTAAGGTETWWQVVTVDSAVVQRGTTSLATAATTASVPISNAQDALVVASYTANATGATAAASMMVDIANRGTQLEISRRQGGVPIEVAWEVVSLPFFSKAFTTELAAGEAMKTTSIPDLPAASSVALASTQSVLGPSTGATTYNGNPADLIGEAAVTLTPRDGDVVVQRTSTTAAATISWTVLDLAHAPCDYQ
ncbi:MAG: hypothetical protein SFX73_15450 [Kofleriaceae bacterium]|nr:hypothetical protein [Kofleriaceae bacterium]